MCHSLAILSTGCSELATAPSTINRNTKALPKSPHSPSPVTTHPDQEASESDKRGPVAERPGEGNPSWDDDSLFLLLALALKESTSTAALAWFPQDCLALKL
eukprot:Hpha_TRINITY_DN15628_c0_g1::TRINITY_DN15628_c0_g1_i1::g.98036::m.98036